MLVDTCTGQRTGGGAGDEGLRRPGAGEEVEWVNYGADQEWYPKRLVPAGDVDQPRLKSAADLDAPKPQKGGEGIPKLAEGGDVDALRPRVDGAEGEAGRPRSMGPEDVDVPRPGQELIVELGPGIGENLLNIARARPDAVVVGLEWDPGATHFARRINVVRSEIADRILVVEADYTEPPLQANADLVIAVAPGGGVEDVRGAVKAAAALVGPEGHIYVVTDLPAFNKGSRYAEGILDDLGGVLEARGLRVLDKKHGAVSSTSPSQPDEHLHTIGPERNPMGIPLQTIHSPESY